MPKPKRTAPNRDNADGRHFNLALYDPSPWQEDVHHSTARYRILTSGRRAGKSIATVSDNIRLAISAAPPNSPFLFAANVWPETQRSYDQARALLESIELKAQKALGYAKPNDVAPGKKRVIYAGEEKSRFRHKLVNGTYCDFRSAQEPDNLRGPGYYQVVLDEFSEMPREVWDKVLRPTLMERRGRALISGTPKGKALFYELFQRGNNGNLRNAPVRPIKGIEFYSPQPDGTYDPEYQSFHYPTWANPMIDDAEVFKAKAEMSDLAFRQEILAEFLQEGSGVFQNIRACAKGDFEPPKFGEHYVFGYDPARKRDFAGMGIMSRERKCIVWWRLINGLKWPDQLDLVEREAKRYNNAKIVIDSTSLGDPVSQFLQQRGLLVEDVVFKNINKQQLIENLAIMLEHNEVSYPEACEGLIDQLDKFTFTVTAQGRIQYNAPEGQHDDGVTTLALCAHGVKIIGKFLFAQEEQVAKMSGIGITGEVKPEAKKDPQLGWKFNPITGMPFYPTTRESFYKTPWWLNKKW